MAVLDRELRSAATLLSPANVRGYVPRLPQDVDPVAVEPLVRGRHRGVRADGVTLSSPAPVAGR